MQDPARYRRMLDLLGQALDLPVSERAKWLDALTGEDADFRDDLKRLLARQDDSEVRAQVDGGIGAVAAELLTGDDGRCNVGQRIGDYVLERPLGEGGMGVVWLARKDGNVALPPVAIKIPASLGGGAKTAAERLSREGAILAALNHPNIARLIEVGVHGSGNDALPFLALEFIDGLRLPDYCNQKQLSPEARLALFVHVLEAVAYAHSTLVLHRDLKPGNVLVTSGGEIKLLDFGIAKLLDDTGSAGSTELTRLAGRALTPDYASPEQIAGIPLTVASDVYSLGVMLFELLTGERPYKLKRGSTAELEEAILTADTGRPSTVVRAEFATRTQESIRRLRRKLAGDLDTIVLKALKKKPADRYGSVLALKEDIERYLSGRPVLATPDSFSYRVGKFVIRNQLAVGAVAAVFVALVTGLAIALWQAAEARRQARVAATERARAEQRFNDVRVIANSLIFEVHDAIQSLPGATEARTLLTKKAVEFLDKVAAENHADPTVGRELAAGYRKIAEAQNYSLSANLGDAAGANRNHEKAMAILEPQATTANASKDDKAALALTALSYGVSLLEQGEAVRALALTRRGLAIRQALLAADPSNADMERDVGAAEGYLANALFESGDLQGAFVANEAVRVRFKALVEKDPKSARNRWGHICGYSNTASILISMREDARARERMQRAVELNTELLVDRPDHYSVINGFGFYHHLLGEIAYRGGDRETALRSIEKALEYRRPLSARDANDVEAAMHLAKTRAWVGLLKIEQGKVGEGQKLIDEAIASLHALIKQRPVSRRLHSAMVEVKVLRGNGERVLRNERAACASFSEAAALLTELKEKYPALHSLKLIEVPDCNKGKS